MNLFQLKISPLSTKEPKTIYYILVLKEFIITDHAERHWFVSHIKLGWWIQPGLANFIATVSL